MSDIREDIIGTFCKRPPLGTMGREVRVRSNFFEVLSLPAQNIIHYDITITPDVPPALNRKIFKEFEMVNRIGQLNGIRSVFDGRKNIFAPQNFPFGDAATFNVTLSEVDTASVKRPPRIFKIKFKKTREICMEELHRFLQGRNSMTSNCLTAIMALDVLIRHLPSMQHITVGRSFFTKSGSQLLSGGAEAWQGYYQSARPAQEKMLINVDLSATVFYESGPLVQMVNKILDRRTPDDLRRGLTEKERVKVEKSLKNLKIRVIHRGEPTSKRNFKIIKLTPTAASQTRFDTGNGDTTDVANYFANTYGRRLSHPQLPCIIVKKNVYLPMEVCEVIEGQRHIRKLNDKQTADMIKFTCQSPHLRANKIKQGVDILSYRQNGYLKQFGLEVANEMMVVQARVLPVPTLQYHPSSREHSFQPRDGSWNLRDKKVAQGAVLGSWSVIAFGSERDFRTQSIQAFIRELGITCQDNGMSFPNKTPPIMHGNAGNAAKAQPQLIICILPNTGVPLYAEINRVTDTVIGVASQCVQSRHMMQVKKQFCANICLKIDVKLGGMNSFINPSQVPFISDSPTILMGADISHPSSGEPARPSIAALCASMDAKASRYSASIRIQTGRTEIIADLANMVKELLKTFYQTCGRKPERILFYRDGVSEGQFAQVLDGEIKAVRAACVSIMSYSTKMASHLMDFKHFRIIYAISMHVAHALFLWFPRYITLILYADEHDFTQKVNNGVKQNPLVKMVKGLQQYLA